MVTMVQLRDLDVAVWTASANEWHARSADLIKAARDVRDTALNPLTGQAWSGAAGDEARRHLGELVDKLKIDALECQAISYVVHGVTHAFQIAQGSLRNALAVAGQYDFRVTDDGVVHLPTSPMVRHDPDYNAWCRDRERELQRLIRQALDSATQADQRGHDELDRLSRQTSVTSVEEAENGDLGRASKLEVDIIAGTVPDGSPAEIAAWWASLSEDDRTTLESAVPWELEKLDGIPADVRERLHGSDGYDHTGVAQWALSHWNDNSDDPFEDNCTNFASNALEGGGLQQHNDIWTGTLSEDSWSKGPQTGWDWFDEHNYTHSASWAQAQTSYDFWTEPERGTEVDIADAQPGDIIYWEQDDDGYDIPAGTVHHAAVVTSVIDGDIRYTQHSGNQLNASLDGRAPVNEFDGGHQKVHVVRPHPNW